jgi:hypothetical protein
MLRNSCRQDERANGENDEWDQITAQSPWFSAAGVLLVLWQSLRGTVSISRSLIMEESLMLRSLMLRISAVGYQAGELTLSTPSQLAGLPSRQRRLGLLKASVGSNIAKSDGEKPHSMRQRRYWYLTMRNAI